MGHEARRGAAQKKTLWHALAQGFADTGVRNGKLGNSFVSRGMIPSLWLWLGRLICTKYGMCGRWKDVGARVDNLQVLGHVELNLGNSSGWAIKVWDSGGPFLFLVHT